MLFRSLVLFQDGRLSAEAVGRLGTALVQEYAFTPRMLLRSFQDTLRRGALDYDAARRLGEQAAGAGIDEEMVALFAKEGREVNMVAPAHREQIVPDYPALLRREYQRHRIEKQRRRRGSRRRWL